MDLADILREGTKDAHRRTERGVPLRAVKRFLSREVYSSYLRDLHDVYEALESGLEQAQHPLVAPLRIPELYRTHALEEDLLYFCGAGWATAQVSPAGAAYRSRLEELASQQPELLVSHAYVRYLGDLFGGQVIRKIIRAALQLPKGEGTAFYEFPLGIKEGRDSVRSALNALPVDEAMSQRLVAEANYAFELTGAIFRELANAGTGI
ncbi:biliverdin-producing heme oxygenase [Candidatus Woesearchaeota archaeon]|nr:biliverdin-producing heme oxygenase [Candidatus Woesearchaeota archaeon]